MGNGRLSETLYKFHSMKPNMNSLICPRSENQQSQKKKKGYLQMMVETQANQQTDDSDEKCCLSHCLDLEPTLAGQVIYLIPPLKRLAPLFGGTGPKLFPSLLHLLSCGRRFDIHATFFLEFFIESFECIRRQASHAFVAKLEAVIIKWKDKKTNKLTGSRLACHPSNALEEATYKPCNTSFLSTFHWLCDKTRDAIIKS